MAGIYLGRVNGLPIVEAIGSGWLWVAVTAWVVTFVAMIRAIMLRVARRHGQR